VVLSIVAIISKMDISFGKAVSNVVHSPYAETFFWDWRKSNFFFKEFIGGIFIAVAMTGLDQNMMQKNLSCKSLGEAQKNIFWFSIVMALVTFFFLSLGALLYQYYAYSGIELPMSGGKIVSDKVFPNLALNHLGTFAGLVFIVGLTAATFSSADSVLTTLTTSAYVDILEYDKIDRLSEAEKKRRRTLIHIGFGMLLWLVIILFDVLNQKAIIDTVLTVAGYTYGPLLGLFAVGLFTKLSLKDAWVPLVCVLAPVLTYALTTYSKPYLGGYEIGNELIVINGLMTVLGLLMLKRSGTTAPRIF